MHLRIAPADVAVIRAGATRLGITMSELVRRAAMAAAVDAIRQPVQRDEAGRTA